MGLTSYLELSEIRFVPEKELITHGSLYLKFISADEHPMKIMSFF